MFPMVGMLSASSAVKKTMPPNCVFWPLLPLLPSVQNLLVLQARPGLLSGMSINRRVTKD